jgi:hypothetical protein
VAALLLGVSAPALAAEADTIAAQVVGSWRNPAGGTCDQAWFKATERVRTVRNEQAMTATATNTGQVVTGQIILQGARAGQVVNTMNDKAIFLLEPVEGNKLHVIPIGDPALSWTEVTLELCPGSR